MTILRALPILIALAVGTLAPPAVAQTDTLRVGAAERPPFSMQGSDGSWQGIAIDLWRMVAEDQGLAYEIVATDRGELVAGLRGGGLDLALAVDATADAEADIDFLMPFYTATLAVASEREIVVWRVVKSLASVELLRIVLYLSGLLLLVGAVIWLIERRRNDNQFHKGVLPGLGDGFWWAGVTLTTIGYGDKAPITFAGRAVAMIWMLIGLAVSAALTAAVVSATEIQGARTLSIPSDLTDKRVAVIEGGSAEAYLTSLGVSLEPVADFAEAITALREDRADAVAGGAPELAAEVRRRDADLTLTTTTQDPQYVAVALASGSDAALREALNRSILARITSDEWWSLVQRYSPDEN